MGQVRLGIIGTGRIAGRLADELERMEGVRAAWVFNPNLESARRFGEEKGIFWSREPLEGLLGRCEAVYIASPHGTHEEYARRALWAGRHVLCEKPMAFSRQAAGELFSLAAQKGAVLMEMLKTAYSPGFRELARQAQSGKIGRICDVEACFSRLTPRGLREMEDERFGGSLTEFGSYTLFAVLRFMGTDYQDLEFQSIPAENGIDLYTKVFFRYQGGMGLSKTGLGVKSEGQLLIAGTKGYILAPSPWWLAGGFEVRYEDAARVERYQFPGQGNLLRYELEAFLRRVRGGDREEGVSQEESQAMAEILGRFLEWRENGG